MFVLNEKASIRGFLVSTCLLLLSACGVGNEQGFTEAVMVAERNLTAITVISANDRVREGETESFTAQGIVADENEPIDITSLVTWSSSDSSVVSINSAGLATGVSNGTVDIIATLSDLSSSKALRSSDANLVSIEISNQPVSIPVCQTSAQQLIATGIYEDGDNAEITDKVNWVSSAEAIIHVGNEDLTGGSRDNNGILSGLTVGDAIITASQGEVQSTGVSVTVTESLNSLTVAAVEDTLYAGNKFQFSATGDYGDDPVDITGNVTWVSSDSTVLAFDQTDIGLATMPSAGSTNVQAICGQGGVGELSSEIVSLEVKEPVVATALRVELGDDIYSEGEIINLDLSDGDAQLELFLVYNDGSVGSKDLADDEDTSWLDESNTNGISISSSTGFVEFTETGSSSIKVQYRDNDASINLNMSFSILVE